jgi:hypothetical protein
VIVRNWTLYDKSAWGPGAWQDEPDKRQWTDEATGLPCLIVRHPLHGHLCGYVGVSEGHPAFGVSPSSLGLDSGHGGVNYGEYCAGLICHEVEPGENDRVYWLGFDCGHVWDFSPGHEAQMKAAGLPGVGRSSRFSGVYRDLQYVTCCVHQLAAELKAISLTGAGC